MYAGGKKRMSDMVWMKDCDYASTCDHRDIFAYQRRCYQIERPFVGWTDTISGPLTILQCWFEGEPSFLTTCRLSDGVPKEQELIVGALSKVVSIADSIFIGPLRGKSDRASFVPLLWISDTRPK